MKALVATILLALPLLAVAQGRATSVVTGLKGARPLDPLRVELRLADTLDPLDDVEVVPGAVEPVIPPPEHRPYVPAPAPPALAASSLGVVPDAVINSVRLYGAGNEAGAIASLNAAQAGVISTISNYLGADFALKVQALAFGNNGSGATLTGNTVDDVMSLANPLNAAGLTGARQLVVDCAIQALDPRCAAVWGAGPR